MLGLRHNVAFLCGRGRPRIAFFQNWVSVRIVHRLMWAIAARVYGVASDAFSYVVETPRVWTHPGLPAESVPPMKRVSNARRLAIVVLHPRYVEFSIRNLVLALADADFTVVALASKPVPPAIARLIDSAGGVVVTRAHVGRDVGAYQD